MTLRSEAFCYFIYITIIFSEIAQFNVSLHQVVVRVNLYRLQCLITLKLSVLKHSSLNCVQIWLNVIPVITMAMEADINFWTIVFLLVSDKEYCMKVSSKSKTVAKTPVWNLFGPIREVFLKFQRTTRQSCFYYFAAI